VIDAGSVPVVGRARTGGFGLLVIAAVIGLLASVPSDAGEVGRAGICMERGPKLVGVTLRRVGEQIRLPKRTRYVSPKYPELPEGTSGSGFWAGEFLIDGGGMVIGVWAIREVRLTPPLPAFNQAIVDAIRQWKFEPPMIDGRPAALCSTMTVMINWQ